jgi:hypothetical protein
MDEQKALAIVSALANGVNPVTGEVFAPDSPYQSADVVRALFMVHGLLESRDKPKARSVTVPGNAGKPWSKEEDQKLLQEFDGGTSVANLAQAHGRTPAGIQARLEKHGRLKPSPGPEGQGSRRWRSATG